MKPLLLFSELSGQVYIVTRYKHHKGQNTIVAETKFDVTPEFDATIAKRARWAGFSSPIDLLKQFGVQSSQTQGVLPTADQADGHPRINPSPLDVPCNTGPKAPLHIWWSE